MEPIYGDDSSLWRAPIRDGKDRVLSEVAEIAAHRGIRLMRAGGAVFARHGLISPRIARFAAVVVDPERVHELAADLVAAGWRAVPSNRSLLLPPTIHSFARDDFDGVLNLYGLIPGFFVAPSAAFDRIWDLRDASMLGNIHVPVLGKLPTVMFAAHDRLAGQHWSRATETHFNFFLSQFQGALTPAERIDLQSLARELGAEDEVRRMLLGLGLELADAAVPDDAYVRERLALSEVSVADVWLVTRLERPRGRRTARPGLAATSAAVARLVGARRRLRG